MTTQTTTVKTTDAEQCPAWCAGSHGRPAWCKDESTRWWHRTADCPPWCIGHFTHDDERDVHCGGQSAVTISGADLVTVETSGGPAEQPASVEVMLWQGLSHTGVPGPVVCMQQMVEKVCADGFVPDMTPDEAARLGLALLSAAWMADPAALPQREQVTTMAAFFGTVAGRIPAPREDAATA